MSDINAEEAGASVSRPPREDLFRATEAPPTLERADEGGMPTMVVEFARFGEWTLIDSLYEGRFLERVDASALDKTIAESRDQMRVLFNHGKDPQIGDKVLGPISSLAATSTGARGEVSLLDTSYNRDLVPGLEAGLYGASFRFQVLREDFVAKPTRSEHNPDGTPERTILEARVREWGPVTFPAYSGTSAGVRSLTDEFLLGRFVDEPERLLEMIEHLKNRRAESEPSAATTHKQPDEQPEPPVATTPRARATHRAALFTTTRKDEPRWLL